MAKSTIKPLADALVKKFKDTPSRQLARMLYEENRELIPSMNAATLAIRRARGAQGNKNRKQRTVEKEKHNEGWVQSCPPSAAEEWNPVEIEVPAKVLSLSDLHIPYHSKEAIEASVAHAKNKLAPDVLVLNGDFIDFHRISRWETDPKSRNTAEEIETGKQCLSWLRGQFPKARIIYKLGNHCERLDKYIWLKAPELWGMEGVQLHHQLDFEKFDIQRVDDNPIMAGELPIMHGHEFGRSGIAAPVNPARGAFLRTLHSCLVGHLHRTSTHTEPNMFKSETTTWSQGCLCDLSPKYARINKWNWGFCYVEVAADGQYNMHNFRLANDYTVRTA